MGPDQQQFSDMLLSKILTLSEGPWERRCKRREITQWLDNFNGDVFPEAEEHRHLLHLLSVFTYFGDQEIRVLLKSMYRDLFKYPVVEAIRRLNANVTDASFIQSKFLDELRSTRFLGVGNPSESGTHLLYYFRQENGLNRHHFINTHEIFQGRIATSSPTFQNQTVRHYVFIDDFCGSGAQAQQYSARIVADIRDAAAASSLSVQTSYLVLAATSTGIDYVRNNTLFDHVQSVIEFDETYRTFEQESRYYPPELTEVSREKARAIADHYGNLVAPTIPLGYGNGQLLVGFHHNVPDNTLPIIWSTNGTRPWYPIFRRYPKIGG